MTTGQMNFCDATALYCDQVHLLGSAQLTSAGTAILKFIPGMGAHSYKAVFSGTNANGTSSSNASNLTVTAAQASTTTIAQSGTAGQYTLAATVVGQGPIAPSGAVSFLDTSNANASLGSATVASSQTALMALNSQAQPAGQEPYSVAVGDFNGDGKPDLAVTSSVNNSAIVLLGNGDGTFTAGVSAATGSEPESIAAGDFNGDGIADLAVANYSGNTVTVLTTQLTQTAKTAVTGMSHLGNGSHAVEASYAGDSSYKSSVSGTTQLTAQIITPTITVTPSSSSITTAQALTVTVTVSGGNGNPTPTGFAPLVSGTYSAAKVALTNGSASISVPAGSLAVGGDTLTVGYAPDSNSSSVYNTASNTSGSVAVSKATPAVTVSPSSSNITTTQGLTVTIGVSGGTGAPIASGSVTLTSGSYSSSSTTLSNGSTTISILAGSLALGSDTLAVSYTGDTNYSLANGTGSITIARTAPTVTLSPSSTGITTTQALSVTIAVSSSTGAPTPTGSVTLAGGGYTSAATILSSGSATISIPAGSLSVGSDSLVASYTPDTSSTSIYNSAAGSRLQAHRLLHSAFQITPTVIRRLLSQRHRTQAERSHTQSSQGQQPSPEPP